MARFSFEGFSARLSTFFSGGRKHKNSFSSYYLIGYRSSYLLFRTSALADTLHRLYVFLRAGAAAQLTGWLIAWGVTNLPLSLWFAKTAGGGLYIQLGRRYALIFWQGRFFSLRTFYFSVNTVRFLGADVIFSLMPPGRLGVYQLNALRSFGVPTVGIEYNMRNLGFFSYCLPQTTNTTRGLIFYSRLLLCFMRS